MQKKNVLFLPFMLLVMYVRVFCVTVHCVILLF